jgi:hypothetical protein
VKIVNSTHWRTDHLRAFISRLVKEELCDRPQAQKILTVYVKYTRPGPRRAAINPDEAWANGEYWKHGGYSSGCATIGGFRMTIRLPKNHIPDKIDFAAVLGHELAHVRGLRHRDMRGAARYNRIGNWREIYAWGNELPLEIEPPKPKPNRASKAVEREKSARRSLEKWQRRLKLAKTKVRFYSTKVKYYDRKKTVIAFPIAAAEAPSGGEAH